MTGGARGETLVEVVVAILLLAVGALALAGGLAHGERARGRSVDETLALAAAVSWMETWRAASAGSATGSGSEALAWGARTGRLEWVVRPAGPCAEEAEVRAAAGARARATLASRRYAGGSCAE